MNNRTHLFAYLILNIIIAAVTTLTVMWLWEQRHPRQALPLEYAQPISNSTEVTLYSDATETYENPVEPSLTFVSDNFEILIRKVVGAGDLEMEFVEIYNQSQGPIDLSDWQLIDKDGHNFLFPALILNSEGAIKIYSKKGTNTVIELHWQSESPIWSPGEIATLLDAQGNLVATYSIP